MRPSRVVALVAVGLALLAPSLRSPFALVAAEIAAALALGLYWIDGT